MRCGDLRARRRLDTNRTSESLDSGVYSLDARPSNRPASRRRAIQLDDILWCFAFALTVWYFDLPMKLLIDPRINRFARLTIFGYIIFDILRIYILFLLPILDETHHSIGFYLTVAVFLQMLFVSTSILLFIVGRKQPMESWPEIYPKVFPVAICTFLGGCVMFCLATWNVWSFWSIYIVFVTFMFTIVVVSLI